MSRTVAKTLAASAFTIALGVLAVPPAQAVTTAPVTPVFWGSASICYSFPLGPGTLSMCL